jgi:LPXTG-site transpeptidase (sortase) family protein
MRFVGNLLIGLSIVGLLALGAAMLIPDDGGPTSTTATRATTSPPIAIHLPWPVHVGASATSPRLASDHSALRASDPLKNPPVVEHPITHIAIESIGLDADVVDANLVAVDGGVTWQVPPFKVGHAEGTADAGEIGNAVLLGHVTSVRSGNVFQDLDRVQVGDTVQVFSDSELFEYTVVSTDAVPRSDTSVLQPNESRSVSLITCTGVWLPTIWDYTERLVVHAELAQ